MEDKPTKRRPRIRKSAPTVRQRVEKAQAKTETPAKPKRVKSFASKAGRPLKQVGSKVRVRLPDNRFGRIIRRALGWLVPRYFINSWREVRQVTWPSRTESWRLTVAVFVFATVFGAAIYGVDRGLDEIFKRFIIK